MNRVALTFIIPIKHQLNSNDWEQLKKDLSQTMCSISAQTNGNWKAIIVANEGADLPDVPENFDVIYVDFPCNPMYEQGINDKEVFYDAVRKDKGSRILKGMIHQRNTDFYMVVDADDFVSNQLVEFVSKNKNANGWEIKKGYIWSDAGRLLLIHENFSNVCGTSLIIKSTLYDIPEKFEYASQEYIKTMLGSHIKIASILNNAGTPLNDLPFLGAIYRVGHSNSHSKSRTIFRLYFFNIKSIFKPFIFFKNLLNLRLINASIKKEYFGCHEL